MKSKKVYYFPKDYAPARALANQKKSQKKSKTTSAKTSSLSKNIQKSAKSLSKTAKTLSSKTQKTFAKLNKNLPRKTKTVAAKKSHTAKHKRNRFTWREITLASQIAACLIVIVFSLGYSAIADPVKRSERELEKLANAYYIEYLYPHALGKNLNQPETILADYVQQGLPAVRLRQLLLYNNGKHANSIDAFSNQYYECDTSQTYVRYFPVEPYGPRDYTVAYGTACEKVSLAE